MLERPHNQRQRMADNHRATSTRKFVTSLLSELSKQGGKIFLLIKSYQRKVWNRDPEVKQLYSRVNRKFIKPVLLMIMMLIMPKTRLFGVFHSPWLPLLESSHQIKLHLGLLGGTKGDRTFNSEFN